MAQPEVSIIVPAYNAEAFIADALRSCIGVEGLQVEVIVIDDGSRDATPEIVRRFPVHYVRQENLGAPRARNLGLELARSDLVKFLDADDLLAPGCLERQISEIRCLGPCDVVYGDYETVDAEGIRQVKRNTCLRPGSLADMVRADIMTTPPLHRRALLQAVGGFDEKLRRGQEWNLHVRLVARGARFHYRAGTDYIHRLHDAPGRISNRYAPGKPLFYAVNCMKAVRTRKAVAESLDPETESAFAEFLFRLGRHALRSGNLQIGLYCIRRAEQIAPGAYKAFSRWPYRLLRALLGPVGAERTLQLRRFIA